MDPNSPAPNLLDIVATVGLTLEAATAQGYAATQGTFPFQALGKAQAGLETEGFAQIISDKKTIRIPGKDFRSILGGNYIRSTDFQVTIADSDAVFEGSGWGHGVGLCQWGAYFMAKQGATSEEIIQYYYPGVEITAADGL